MFRLYFVLAVINSAIFASIAIFLIWRTCQPSAPVGEVSMSAPIPSLAVPCRLPGPRRLSLPRLTPIAVLAPQFGADVSQWGTSVRFRLAEPQPIGTRPVLFLRDGTGLDTNWWVWDASPTSTPGVWESHVQFGEVTDRGAHFALTVLLLRNEDCPTFGTVGSLPAQALARSEIVGVVRE